jgi:signal transduction histidine kinase
MCRRAIAPVGRLATAAMSISASNLEQRLPEPGTNDEMDEFVQAFNGLLARLQDSFERQRRFSGDASHQLRTPLTAMLGQVEVALRHERTPVEYRAVLDRVLGQAVDMRQIVESLLFLARADSDANAPLLEPMSLSAFLRTHLKRWSSHPRATDFHIQTPDEDELLVNGSAPLFAQLVDNLLENACKYSVPGTAITVLLRRESECIALIMEDRGRGIAEEDLPHIFEPFYRSTSARQQGIGGVGLGLAVAKRIATVLGSNLSVESTIGRGSRFTLRLAATTKPTVRSGDVALLVPANEEA